MHLCLWPDRCWQILYHDGQAGGGARRNHSHGLFYILLILLYYIADIKTNINLCLMQPVYLDN